MTRTALRPTRAGLAVLSIVCLFLSVGAAPASAQNGPLEVTASIPAGQDMHDGHTITVVFTIHATASGMSTGQTQHFGWTFSPYGNNWSHTHVHCQNVAFGVLVPYLGHLDVPCQVTLPAPQVAGNAPFYRLSYQADVWRCRQGTPCHEWFDTESIRIYRIT